MLQGTAGPLSAAPCARRAVASQLPALTNLIRKTSSPHIATAPVNTPPGVFSTTTFYHPLLPTSPLPKSLHSVQGNCRAGPLAFAPGCPLSPSGFFSSTSPLASSTPLLRGSRWGVSGTATAASPPAMPVPNTPPDAAASAAATDDVILLPDSTSDTTTTITTTITINPSTSSNTGLIVEAAASSPPLQTCDVNTAAAEPLPPLDAKAATRAAAEAAYASSGSVLRTKRPPGMVKRSIALHVGYVGTAFKGLQVNRSGAPDSTVEEVLERAVFEAALIAESNFGDLKKVKWSRNSRTDKGVHSVSTVVGLRVLLRGDERFDSDPEGLEIAAALNTRLPQQVRVFSAQRVQKKFNARRFCFDRTYEYFLPAYLLLQPLAPRATAATAPTEAATAAAATANGLATYEEAAALQEALAKLREALRCYVGTHPFHNYTAKRKTYVKTAGDKEARREAREAAATAAATATDAGTDEEEERMAAEATAAEAAEADGSDGEDNGGGDHGDVRAQLPQGQRQRRSAAKEEDAPLEEDDEEGETEGAESLDDEAEGPEGPSRWIQSCRWLYEKSEDKRDRVTVRHFRTITSFTADDPAPLVPGGVPCVRLQVRGMSFMLHQIRHMIGGALAVARGSFPLPLLRASLAGNARITVPRAPPHTLILADCTFPPFRKAGADEARVFRWSGERLQLRPAGQRNLVEFRRQSLDPALNELLRHPDWDRFERCLPRFYWDPQDQEDVIRAHAAWEATRAERARQREAEAVAAAAAAAAAAGAGDTTQPPLEAEGLGAPAPLAAEATDFPASA